MEKLIYCQKSRIPTANLEDILDGEQIKVEGLIYERIFRRPNNRRPLRSLISEKLQQRIVIYG
jgi:hypothetical protein